MMTIRVLLVDDDPLLRAGLRLMLRVDPDIEVVGEADDGGAAIDAAATLRPDVIPDGRAHARHRRLHRDEPDRRGAGRSPRNRAHHVRRG